MKAQGNKPHPLLNWMGGLFSGIWSLFSPVVAWWSFMGMVPLYFQVLVVLFCVLVGLKVLQFFFGRQS